MRFRFLTILYYWVRFFLAVIWLALRRKLNMATFAARLRVFVEQMGFLWVKIGQLLSLRQDIVPVAICEQLSKLQYQALGFDPAVSRKVIESELGCRIEDIFDEFEEHPFAAASISQVHRARLKEKGTRVAVKVQRPDVKWIFKKDMKLARMMVRLLRWFNVLPFMRWQEGLWELTEIMQEETDYRFESSNLRRLKKVLRNHKVYVPKVFRAHSAQHVLTMEFIDAPLMTEFLDAKAQRPEETEAWLKENKIKPKKLGQRLYLSLLRQIFEDEIFHGDMHPGNIMLLRNSRFALIDFGTAGHLEYEWLEKYVQSMMALTERNYAKAADLFLYLCPNLPPIDLTPAKEEMIRVFRNYAQRAAIKDLPYQEKSMSYMALELTKVWLKYGIMMGWSFAKMDRSFSTLDASLEGLIPEEDSNLLIADFFEQRRARRSKECFKRKNIARMIHALPEALLENRLYISNLLRNGSRVIAGTRTKLSHVVEVFVRVFRWAVALGGLYLIYHYTQPKAARSAALDTYTEPLAPHVTGFVEWLVPDFLDDGSSIIGSYWWLALVFVSCYLFFRSWRLIGRLQRNDIVDNKGPAL